MCPYFLKNFWFFFNKSIYAALLCATATSPILAQQKKIDSLTKIATNSNLKLSFSQKDTSYIQPLIDLGDTYRYVNSDSLLAISKKISRISTTLNYKYGNAFSFVLLGDYYSDKGKNRTAIDNYHRALNTIEEGPAKRFKLRIINSLAGEYEYIGNYAKALGEYLKGIDLANEIDHKPMISSLNENIANLYASQKDYKQALQFYKKVIEVNKLIDDAFFSAQTFSNIAWLYAEKKQFDYAMFYINKGIATFEKHEIFEWLAFAYEVKGEIYLKQKKYKWALYWYEQSKMIHGKIDDERGQINMLNGMSKTYYELEKDSLAMVFAEKGFRLSQKINSLDGQKNCSNTLYKIYKKNKDYSNALLFHELTKNLTDSLSSQDNKKSLSLLKAKLGYEKQKEELIIENNKALAEQRIIIYSSLILLLILAGIIFIVVRNQRIQKRLNKKLNHKTALIQKREVELSDINRTKNKLFSIIGHDLRGPIGALQELLRLFSNGEIKKNELDSFMPKLKSDVDNVFFTLNNLLSWGQSQINGSSTRPKKFSIKNLVDINIKLLSEMAYAKSIKIINHIEDMPIAWADENQIDIIIRNLISNALKFTPEHGLITITLSENANLWEVCIKDTGVGMTQDMQSKVFANHTNITTYGTNNEKGTGLGLSLCKEMVEKNNGQIRVDSKINKGSTFYFTMPKEKTNYQRAS